MQGRTLEEILLANLDSPQFQARMKKRREACKKFHRNEKANLPKTTNASSFYTIQSDAPQSEVNPTTSPITIRSKSNS